MSMVDQSLAIRGGRPVRSEFLVFGSPLIGEAEIAEVVATLRSGWLGTGPRTHRFEDEFARYVGSQYAVALSSCTAGLHLALDVVGVGPGDLVVTSPLTFAATANVIVHCGASPLFADVDRRTMNLDPNRLADAVKAAARRLPNGGRLKAIIPVHMAGRPCDMDAILSIARRYDLAVVEDAAHAAEAVYRGRRVGTLGDLAAFSFYVTKNICTGEGGMLTTDRADWADEIRIKSLHGLNKDAWKRYSTSGFQPYEVMYPGYKYNMTDVQAALGIHQLARVEENLAVRDRHWHSYDDGFADLPEVETPLEESEIRHARHLYTILLNLDRLTCDRNSFVAALQAEGIGVGVHFTALHLHQFYRNAFGFRPGDFPNAEWIGERTVSLPISAKLTDEDVTDVITAVKKVARAYRC
jgi:dTDP-4-amino-4,6-dideoxygalactose transaminase